FVEGRPSPLEELPIQYADYALWQREWLQGEVLERQLEYWRRQLAGAPAFLELPTDRPRPPGQTYRGARGSLRLSADLTRELKLLSSREGATLFMTLLAAFQALLSRYTGQDDVSVGAPVAGRTLPETENLIGLFLNTLVLRTDLSDAPTFTELLGRVRETCFGAYAHQDIPFEMLIEELQPERSLSHTPLFQVMLNLLNISDAQIDLAGLSIEEFPAERYYAKFDLTLYAAERGDKLQLTMAYNVDLFEDATAERALRHLTTLLESI